MGEKKRTVVLYGNSLVISSIAASLESQPHLSVHQIHAPGTDLHQLESLNPDVLIFDMAAAQPDYAIALLGERPRLSLIGVDPDNRQMLLWSSQHARALTVQDLVQAINALPGSTGRLARPWQFIAAQAASRIRTRKRRLALAAVVALLGLVTLLGLSLAYPNPNAPLIGTAAGAGPAPELALAFAAGMALGGILIGLWLRFGRRRNPQKP